MLATQLCVSLDGGFLMFSCKAVDNKIDLDLRSTGLANFDESLELFNQRKLHLTPGLSSKTLEEGAEGLGSNFFSSNLE